VIALPVDCNFISQNRPTQLREFCHLRRADHRTGCHRPHASHHRLPEMEASQSRNSGKQHFKVVLTLWQCHR
jgi:hypothetical protein